MRTKGDAALETPCASIKLFGKTVLITASHEPCPTDVKSYKSMITKSCQENLNIVNGNSIDIFPSQKLDAHTGNWRPSPFEAPQLEPHKQNSIAENTPTTPLKCWSIMSQGLPFLYVPESNLKNRLMEKEILYERSCSGSSTGSVSELENREKISNAAVDFQSRQSCSPVRASPSYCRKGFVPYKRCLLEEDVKSSIVVSEEREPQRARVCS